MINLRTWKQVKAGVGLFFIALAPLIIGSSPVYAAVTSPANGTPITTNPVAVEWESDAEEYWLRIYRGGAIVHDSGRLVGTVTSHSASFPADASTVEIRHYRKIAGAWASASSTHTVNLGGGDVGGNGDNGGNDNGTLASLDCSSGEIAKYNGSDWVCTEDRVGESGTQGPKGDPGADGLDAADDPDLAADLLELFVRVAAVEAAVASTYEIGDTGPAGGIVFALDGTGGGLEAAQADLPGSFNWYGASVAASTHTEPDGALLGWYLPNSGELNLLFQQAEVKDSAGMVLKSGVVGGFVNGLYWSSSQINASSAWHVNFNDVPMTFSVKGEDLLSVRAVRAF